MLANRAELARILQDDPARLGRVFARHAYGMRAWVDLFSPRVAATDDAEVKQLLAELVADNARHMNLFRTRARAHGIDPDAYRAPAEGEAIYARIEELHELGAVAGYALGSLDHFTELLGVYAEVATGEDADAVARVRADVEAMRDRLAPLATGAGDEPANEAHELYRRRELVETAGYAHAG